MGKNKYGNNLSDRIGGRCLLAYIACTRYVMALQAREISSTVWQVPTYTTEQTLNFHHVYHYRHLRQCGPTDVLGPHPTGDHLQPGPRNNLLPGITSSLIVFTQKDLKKS
jgi:hypothetical protein